MNFPSALCESSPLFWKNESKIKTDPQLSACYSLKTNISPLVHHENETSLKDKRITCKKDQQPLPFPPAKQCRHTLNYNKTLPFDQKKLMDCLDHTPELVSIDLSELPIDDTVLKKIANLYPYLIHLNVANCSLLTQKGFNTLALSCQHLKSLNTSGIKINDGGFNQLLKANQNLLKWIASNCIIGPETLLQLAFYNPNLTHFIANHSLSEKPRIQEFKIFIKKCPKLIFLNLQHWPDITDSCLYVFIDHLKTLKTLILSDCKSLSPQAIIGFVAQSGVKNLGLTQLNFNFTPQHFEDIFTDDCLLEKISLSGLKCLQAKDFDMLKKCRHLTAIELTQASQLDDRTLASLLSALPRIQKIVIHATQLEGEFLRLTKNKHLTSISITTPLTNLHHLRKFENDGLQLTSLYLTYNDIFLTFNAQGLFDLIQANPHLQKLWLIASEEFPLSSKQMKMLCLTQLTSLTLTGKTSINETIFAAFIEKNPLLTSIDLSSLTYENVEEFAEESCDEDGFYLVKP